MSVWPDPQSIRVGPTYYCYYKAGDATTTITITTTTSTLREPHSSTIEF